MAEENKENLEKEAEKEKKTDWKKELISDIVMVLACIAVAFLINTFILVNAKIPSSSMENTTFPGDRLYASRLSYTFGEPKRGDIAIFYYPVDKALGEKRMFIKRVIGEPGDTIKIEDAKVYINGSETPLDEPYLKEEWTVRNTGMNFEVPEGYYFMMGDNRNNSSDGRYWGERAIAAGVATTPEEAFMFSFVPKEDMLGKAGLRYWPLNKISFVH